MNVHTAEGSGSAVVVSRAKPQLQMHFDAFKVLKMHLLATDLIILKGLNQKCATNKFPSHVCNFFTSPTTFSSKHLVFSSQCSGVKAQLSQQLLKINIHINSTCTVAAG